MPTVNVLTPDDLHTSIARNPDGQNADKWGVAAAQLVDATQGNILKTAEGNKLRVSAADVAEGLAADETKTVTLQNASGTTTLGKLLVSS